MARTDPRLGWIPDRPDHRDHLFAAAGPLLAALPAHVDLRPKCPPVYDQGQVGSCTANAIAGAVEFDRRKQKLLPDFVPARLFIYYNERALEGTVNSDAGAMLRDGIKSVKTQGVCPETMWPYDGGVPSDQGGPNTKVFQKPPAACYTEALKHTIVSYQRIQQNLAQMKGCLAAGFPFVFGFTVFDSFPMQTQTGIIPMPSLSESELGGHAVMAVGYDDAKHTFIIRNSWNTTWGQGGYGFMPYSYLQSPDLSSDFWTIRVVQ